MITNIKGILVWTVVTLSMPIALYLFEWIEGTKLSNEIWIAIILAAAFNGARGYETVMSIYHIPEPVFNVSIATMIICIAILGLYTTYRNAKRNVNI